MTNNTGGFRPTDVCRHCGWPKTEHRGPAFDCPTVVGASTSFEAVMRVVPGGLQADSTGGPGLAAAVPGQVAGAGLAAGVGSPLTLVKGGRAVAKENKVIPISGASNSSDTDARDAARWRHVRGLLCITTERTLAGTDRPFLSIQPGSGGLNTGMPHTYDPAMLDRIVDDAIAQTAAENRDT